MECLAKKSNHIGAWCAPTAYSRFTTLGTTTVPIRSDTPTRDCDRPKRVDGLVVKTIVEIRF